jgi:phosphoribosylglycinamide formyltransferase-1
VSFQLAIFASGSGSNAEKIMAHFDRHPKIKVALLLSNKKEAGALLYAEKYKVPSLVFDRTSFYHSDDILTQLKSKGIDLIVLAGFLWLIPEQLLEAYPNRIINIHPSLLPKYGGKGMYGHHVHQAVFDNMETESGVSIHVVNKEYDKGEMLYQEKVALDITDTPDIIAQKVLRVEHQAYPTVIEQYVLSLLDH